MAKSWARIGRMRQYTTADAIKGMVAGIVLVGALFGLIMNGHAQEKHAEDHFHKAAGADVSLIVEA